MGCGGWGLGEELKASMPSLGVPPPPISPHSPIGKLSEAPPSGYKWRLWQLIQRPAPASSLEVRVGGTKSSPPLIP